MSAEVQHQQAVNHQSYTPQDQQLSPSNSTTTAATQQDHMSTSTPDLVSSKPVPPPIPHISANVTPLNVILKRQSIYTYKQLKEFIKTLKSNSQSDNVKKKIFLELLVKIRENFIRLYVLCKWSRNSQSIEKLIDLFVWLREQNQLITNSLMSIGSIKQSLISAKLPNPDLSTALEVLIKGRPQLPTYNYLPEKPLNPALILKTLKNLNVELSTRMALQEQLPAPFHKYTVKDGKVIFNVPNSFECKISIANDRTDSNFFLVDFKLGFNSKENELVPSITSLPKQTFKNLEKIANIELNKNGLTGLFNLLHNYSITCKLYLLHRQLIQLRMGLWKGHLTHSYNADKCFVVITYWLKRKSIKSTIEIGKFKSNELGFRWIKEGELNENYDLKLVNFETNIINVELLIRGIIKKHIEINIENIQSDLMSKVENVDKLLTVYNNGSQLILNASHNKSVIYSIDSLSGEGYFQNPTPLMNSIVKQINIDQRLTSLRLLNLRLEVQLNELSSMLKATGWINVDVIKLNNNELSKLNINSNLLKVKHLLTQLFTLRFYRRKEWPTGWFLTVGVSGYSSNIEWWCSRIKSFAGQWSISYVESISLDSKDLQYDYFSLLSLVKLTTSKLLLNLIIKELKDLGCKLKILNKNDENVKKFVAHNFKSTNLSKELEQNNNENSLIVLNNESLFNIPNCRDSLVLSITINNKNNLLNISIFGKLQNELKLSNISFTDDKNNSIELNPLTSIFEVNSKINLTEKLKFNSITATATTAATTATTNNDMTDCGLILNDSLSVLNKLSSLMSLLQLISIDETLKVLDISLTKVTFQYGTQSDESITLRILNENNFDSVLIELPETNPHKQCLKYLNEMISNDLNFNKIRKLINYLKLSLPLYKTFNVLNNENYSNMIKFIEENNNSTNNQLKLSPSYGFELNLFGFEMFNISYYKLIDKKIEKKLRFDKFKINLIIKLRNKSRQLSLKSSLYIISIESNVNDSLDENTKLLNDSIMKKFNQIFNSEIQIPLTEENGKLDDGKKIVYLRNSVACNYKCVGQVIAYLHQAMKDCIFQD